MKNTIITITGKTCSGKTFLLDQLLEDGIYSKLVTSTTRGKREGEKDGKDYNFIQSGFAEHLIDSGKFVEYNVYGNQVYGLTEHELNAKLFDDKIPCIILTPNGVDAYERILAERGIRIISVFIDCSTELLVERLAKRTLKETVLDEKALKLAISRAISVATNEQNWPTYRKWDITLSAGDKDLPNQLKKYLQQF